MDCCPPGTIWCVPAGTDGSTVNEVWVSTNGCGTCTWCQLCGLTHVNARYLGVDFNVPPATLTIIPYDLDTVDLLGEFTPGPGGNNFVARRSGTYNICASIHVRADVALANPIIQALMYRNGANLGVVAEHYGIAIPHTAIGTVFKGCWWVRMTAGDTFDIRLLTSDTGGNTIIATNISQNLQIKRVHA